MDFLIVATAILFIYAAVVLAVWLTFKEQSGFDSYWDAFLGLFDEM